MIKNTRTLEINCYVVGLGAFAIFLRWMQRMIAYNEEGVVDKSSFNFLVIAIVFVSAFIFIRFIKKCQKELLYLPKNFCTAFKNEGRVYSIIRWACGAILCAGAILLALTCETDKNAYFLYAVAALGALTGISFPLFLAAANRPVVYSKGLSTFLSFIPILLFSVWLLTCYKQNSINPVTWDYVAEILGLVFSLIAFYRLAGFAFGAPNEWRTIFFCMIAAVCDLMCLADERDFGQQIMFAGVALLLVLANWIIIDNLKVGKSPDVKEDDGFEKLNYDYYRHTS